MSTSRERPTCDHCGDVVDDEEPITRIGDDRRVCNPSCAFELLLSEAVQGDDDECPVCGLEHHGGRVPNAEGYEFESCTRCAREIERRAPRPGEAA